MESLLAPVEDTVGGVPEVAGTGPGSFTTSPEGGQEIDLYGHVRGLQLTVHQLSAAVESVELALQASLSRELTLREELDSLRAVVSDLDSRMRGYPLMDEEKMDKNPPLRSRSKTASTRKGDVLNIRHKTKASYDEDASPEEISSSDEEGPAHPTTARGRSLGRRVHGLVELESRLPEYQGLVSYRAYRLKDTEQLIDEEDTGRVNGYLKRVKHHFSYTFAGDPPLKVLDFLSTLKEALDLNHVSEGVAALILPYLLAGEAKEGVQAMWKENSPKVPKYPAAVAWLLESYATDSAMDAAADQFLTAKQRPGEGEDTFATRLRKYAADAGNVFKEDALVSRYLAGLHPYTANTIRGHVTAKTRFTQVRNLAVQAGAAGREAGVTNRGGGRLPVPGLLPVRSKPLVSASVDSPPSSTISHGYYPYGEEGMVPVAATADSARERTPSESSAPLSDASFPSRGWVSVADPVPAYSAIAALLDSRGCHLCFEKGHFLLDCPLLGAEAKNAALRVRRGPLNQDRGSGAQGMGSFDARTPTSSGAMYNTPRASYPSPRPSYTRSPMTNPRYGQVRMCDPVAAVQSKEDVAGDGYVPPAATPTEVENDAGDI
jgi:hypothetical protein